MPKVMLNLSEAVAGKLGDQLTQFQAAVEKAEIDLAAEKLSAVAAEAAAKVAREKQKADTKAEGEKRRLERAAEKAAKEDLKYRRHRSKGLAFMLDQVIARNFDIVEGTKVDWTTFLGKVRQVTELDGYTFRQVQLELPRETPLSADGLSVMNLKAKATT